VKTADLHLHTHFSDGTFTPEELAGRAAALGLAAVALTDHDTLEGCPRMAAACAAPGLEFIPGTELTAETEGQEVHVLGYWLDAAEPVLAGRLLHFQQVRQRRIHDMVARLNEHGVGLRLEAVLALANCHSPGRPHVARALVDAGYARDFDHAFERHLKRGRPGFVPKARMEAAEAIALIHGAGGAAVLAHPGLYRNGAILPRLAALGLDGVECWHTKHSAELAADFARRAAELGLVATGGSDCHGLAKGEALIGRVRLPYANVVALAARRPTTATAG
jgi:3',5'-nucleoside bisphosphate phosphatase